MRISDEQYFRTCIAKERHLAQLLGYQHIEECYESVGTLWDKAQALPQWTRDWQACGPLLAMYRMSLAFTGQEGGTAVTVGSTTVAISDHPSPDRALMFAIVREVIHRLERHHVHTTESAAPLHPQP